MSDYPFVHLNSNPKINLKRVKDLSVGEKFRYKSLWYELFSSRFAYVENSQPNIPSQRLLSIADIREKFIITQNKKD